VGSSSKEKPAVTGVATGSNAITTGLYERRNGEVSLSEVERIGIKVFRGG
jgi:hypothetical protein